MINKFMFITLLIIPLTAQPSHSEKIKIKKKIGGVSIYGDIDHRTTKEKGFHYRHFEIGSTMQLAKSWTATLQYRNIYSKDSKSWILGEKRPKIAIQKTINTRMLKWTIRSQQEYRIRNRKNDALRHRVRFMSKSNSTWRDFTPFIANEFFYDMEKNEYNKNWFVVGVELKKNKLGTPAISYRFISNQSEEERLNSYTLIYKITF